jgi:ABC-type branched-subunit amino acid transport system substrate-binding protein
VAFAKFDSLKVWNNFKTAYKAKWNAEPDGFKVAGLSYDAYRILVTVLDPEEMRNHSFESVYGVVRFDQNGANTRTAIYTVEGGKLKDVTQCESQNQDFQD